MKLLVIPDIHNKWEIAEKIIAKEQIEDIVFLGDYFDSYDDDPVIARKTALWLKASLAIKGRIHLWGNHDLAYFSANMHAECPGHDGIKQLLVSEVLQYKHWSKLRFFYFNKGWLFTHAGLHRNWVRDLPLDALPDFLQRQSCLCHRALAEKHVHHWFMTRSDLRGGSQFVRYGGILWCDHFEFVPITGVKQIFGHTTIHQVGNDFARLRIGETDNFVLDTGLNHYGVIHDNGELEVKRYE